MSRLVRLELERLREDRPISRLQNRASHEFQRSAPIPKTQIPHIKKPESDNLLSPASNH